MPAGCPHAETAVRFFAGRPSPTMTRRGEALSVVAPARTVSGRGRRCERCDSGRVADRPFARHPEAPDRGGQSTRLAPPVRPALVQDQRRPGHYGGDPLPCSSGPNSPEPSQLRLAGARGTVPMLPKLTGAAKSRKCLYLFGLRDFMWANCGVEAMGNLPVSRFSTPCGNVYPQCSAARCAEL